MVYFQYDKALADNYLLSYIRLPQKSFIVFFHQASFLTGNFFLALSANTFMSKNPLRTEWRMLKAPPLISLFIGIII